MAEHIYTGVANLLQQEEHARRMHREALDRLRAEGATVIEHTAGDATVIVYPYDKKEGKKA